MTNELKMPHLKVLRIYMGMQAVSCILDLCKSIGICM